MNDRARHVERLVEARTQPGRADAFGADHAVALEHQGIHPATSRLARRGRAGGAATDDDQFRALHRFPDSSGIGLAPAAGVGKPVGPPGPIFLLLRS